MVAARALRNVPLDAPANGQQIANPENVHRRAPAQPADRQARHGHQPHPAVVLPFPVAVRQCRQ